MEIIEYVILGISIMTLSVVVTKEVYEFLTRAARRKQIKREARINELQNKKQDLENKIKSHQGIVSQIMDETIKASFEAIIKQAKEEIKLIEVELTKLEENTFHKNKEVIQK